ncbi:MAG: RnfABCDGE type electron transport complex subunit A [Clostridia bacterium]|nr:RnfABCDGE type electron transport complex subunit A [Clostridia bacterium]
MIKAIVAVFLAGIFTENMVLSKFMGICPFLGVSKKVNTAFGMSAAVVSVMVLATAVTWPVYHYLLVPNGLDYLQTVVFILIIAALVQLVEILLKKFIPALHKSLGVYLPLITTNCAVLGIALLVQDNGYNYVTSLFSALGSGIGFMVAMLMFAGVRQRLEKNDIPKALQGLPITLISASLVSLSFLGFSGLLDRLS